MAFNLISATFGRAFAGVRLAAFAIVLAVGAATGGAQAAPSASGQPRIHIEVDKSKQEMTVTVDGVTRYTWKVSTGRAGFATPSGSWHPTMLKEMHYSRKYDNAPMPHSIFFTGGYAIHATNAVGKLGRPASHGCVRLAPKNAETLYDLVERYGAKNVTISIVA